MIAELFNLNRFWLLLWNDLRANIRNLGLLMLCMAGFYVGLSVWAAYYGYSDKFLVLLPILCLTTLFGGGWIFTLRAFRELHERNVRTFHLALPVTRLECLTERWLLTGILFPLATIISFVLIQGLAFLLVRVFFHASIQFTDSIAFIYSRWFRYTLGAYLVIQPFFLLGSSWFASKAFLKTLAAISGFVVILHVMLYATSYTVGWLANVNSGGLTNFKTKMVFQSERTTTTLNIGEHRTPRSPEQSADTESKSEQSTASSNWDDSSGIACIQFLGRLWTVYGCVLLPMFCLITTHVRLGELED